MLQRRKSLAKAARGAMAKAARGAMANATSCALRLFAAGSLAALVIVSTAPVLDSLAQTKSKTRVDRPVIGQGRSGLPNAVNEMRDAILAAARSGRLDELMIPIQWNELPPDFGDLSVEETLAKWKKASPDGSGREWLAKLINLLEAPYAVLRKGRDIENNKLFVWPAFSELPLAKLPPALHVELLRLVPAAEAARMITQGHYDGHGLAIGADGTWHVFKKIAQPIATKK